MDLMTQTLPSPVGPLHLVASHEALYGVIFASMAARFAHLLAAARASDSPLLAKAKAQLDAYFAGERQNFELPLSLVGTAFQKKVWAALAAIPFGETRTYRDQAAAIDQPRAVRAVGRAHGFNPLSIVLPCHRVVGQNGSLIGYAGGLEAKRYLLDFERRTQAS